MRAARGTALHFDGPPPADALLLGLEHEFQVFLGAEPVDFRTVKNQCVWIQMASFEPASRPDDISTN